MSQMELPVLPVQPEDFLSYVEQNPSVSIPKLLEPFLEYEGALRRVFAQAIDHPVVQNPTLNLVDVFKNNNHQKARIRGRDLLNESQEEKEK